MRVRSWRTSSERARKLFTLPVRRKDAIPGAREFTSCRCHPTCSSANLSTFSLENSKSAGEQMQFVYNQNDTARIMLLSQSGLRGNLRASNFYKFPGGSMPPDLPIVYMLIACTYTSNTHVTPLLKILATGLNPVNTSHDIKRMRSVGDRPLRRSWTNASINFESDNGC